MNTKPATIDLIVSDGEAILTINGPLDLWARLLGTLGPERQSEPEPKAAVRRAEHDA